MEKIHVLLINGDDRVFHLPEDVTDFDEMLDFVNENIGCFVKLYKIDCHDCIYPYVIDEYIEYTPVSLNFTTLPGFEFDELFVLTKEEYDGRLRELIDKNCGDCIHYEEGDDIDSHRNHMCLNGCCSNYQPRNEADGAE